MNWLGFWQLEEQVFDSLCRSMATTTSRRSVIQALALGVLGATVGKNFFIPQNVWAASCNSARVTPCINKAKEEFQKDLAFCNEQADLCNIACSTRFPPMNCSHCDVIKTSCMFAATTKELKREAACDPCPKGTTCSNDVCCPQGTVGTGTCCCTGTQGCCSGVCTEVQTDRNNCGFCGRPCTGDYICAGGQCVCPPNTESCASGLCCKGSDFCCNGKCCSALHGCCGGECVQLGTQDNCKTCGDQCRGGQTCVDLNCQCPSVGQQLCPTPNGAQCTSLTDCNNCGDCGVKCGPCQTCDANGVLVSACDSAQCETCQDGQCVGCTGCSTCVNGACQPKDCGPCKQCDPTTGSCVGDGEPCTYSFPPPGGTVCAPPGQECCIGATSPPQFCVPGINSCCHFPDGSAHCVPIGFPCPT